MKDFGDEYESAWSMAFPEEMIGRAREARADYLGELGQLYRETMDDIESVWDLLESPLEHVAIFQLAACNCSYRGDPVYPKVARHRGQVRLSEHPVQLIPQVSFGPYRVDFLFDFGATPLLLAVECDGARFHVDKAKDAVRDNFLRRTYGVHVLRLRGREIWRDNQAALMVAGVIQAWTLRE